jgi:2,3-bisphosphoglycerate-independent phosphoglycerate mutase
MPSYKPVILAILDGWGETQETKGNAIAQATLPNIDILNKYYPKTLLQASGISVGLPWGESGNSEVGHQSLGTGQIIYQNLPRIILSIEDGSFFENQILKKTMTYVNKNKSRLHLLGLVSDGAVHAHIDHLFALMEMAKDNKVSEVFIHAITDGRDTNPQSGIKFINALQEKCTSLKTGTLASITGRFYTMDRNNNWDRIKKGFDAMVSGIGVKTSDPIAALKEQYAKEIFDEYIEPVVIVDKKNQPVGNIQDGDAVIFFNYREDRARQITKAFTIPNFSDFSVKNRPDNLLFCTFIEYEENLPVEIVFPPQRINTCLSRLLSEHGKKQLRIAETEKYAHVTYFFNGGKEKPYPGEEHILIQSKNVSSYDQIPEMSAEEITDRLIKEIEKDEYDFILVNYANPDMVGHTGNLEASIKAVEKVDECLARLIPLVLKKNGCMLITADHGNVEEVINLRTGEKDTEHSSNPVPCWFITPDNHREEPLAEAAIIDTNGILCDITSTILELFKIPKAPQMECDSLLHLLKNIEK